MQIDNNRKVFPVLITILSVLGVGLIGGGIWYVFFRQIPAPTISPNAGTFTSSQNVSLTDSTTGASIYYTTDGSTPTVHSTAYTAPISVGKSETIKSIAVVPFHKASSEADAAYVINIPITYTLSSRVVDLDALGIKPLKITKSQFIFSKQDISTITAYLAKKKNIPDPPSILVGTVLKVTEHVDGVSSGLPFSRVVTRAPGSNGACDTIPASFPDEYTHGNPYHGSCTLPFNQAKFGDFAQLNDLFQKHNPGEGSCNIPGLSFHWAGQRNDPVEPLKISFTNVSAGPFSLNGYAILTPNISYTPPTFNGLGSLLDGFKDVEFGAAYDFGLKGQISLTAQASYKSDYNLDEDPEADSEDSDAYPQPLYNYPIGVPIPIPTTPPFTVWVVPRLILQSGISGKVGSEWKRTENFDVHFADSIAYQQSGCTNFLPCLKGLIPPSAVPSVSGSMSESSSGNDLSGSFHVDAMPLRATLLLEITNDPGDAYSTDDSCFGVAPAAVLRTDIIANGIYDSASKTDNFTPSVQVRGRLGAQLNLYGKIPLTQTRLGKKFPFYFDCFDIYNSSVSGR